MKRLGRESAFGTPRRAVFLKNTCSGVPEALFLSKMPVRDSPTGCFPQKCLFGSPRSVVFIKNACSGVPEALFSSKTVEIPPVSRVFFFKDGRSNPLDELFFSKTDVPTPWTGYFFQKQMFQPLGRA